jgi:hypothetical protein
MLHLFATTEDKAKALAHSTMEAMVAHIRPGIVPPRLTLRCKPLHPPGLLKSFVSGLVSGILDLPAPPNNLPVGWRFTGATQDVVIVLEVTRVEDAAVQKLLWDDGRTG